MDVYARRRLVAILAIVLVLVLIGVAVAGGGDDESDTPVTTVTGASTPGIATPLSKDEFIDQADDICEESAVGIENISSDDAAQIADEEASLTASQLDQLRSLAPPEEDQAAPRRLLLSPRGPRRRARHPRARPPARGRHRRVDADTEISTAETDLTDAADAYGFSECGSPSDAASGADSTEHRRRRRGRSGHSRPSARHARARHARRPHRATPAAPAIRPSAPAAPAATRAASARRDRPDAGRQAACCSAQFP